MAMIILLKSTGKTLEHLLSNIANPEWQFMKMVLQRSEELIGNIAKILQMYNEGLPRFLVPDCFLTGNIWRSMASLTGAKLLILDC